jgi:chromosome segregation ATPase
VRRLNQALSALHKKSDEIQALQASLALEREKTSKLEAEVKAAWQSPSTTTQERITSNTQPISVMQTNSAVSELVDIRVKWNQEREVWEAGRRNLEEEIVRLTAERDRFETNARPVDELRASWDADQATFRRERELWENERKKLDLQVTEMLGERIRWVEERDRLAAQIKSLTETGATFKATQAQWEQEKTAITAERAAWVSERESWAQQQTGGTRERALWDVHREAMELQSATWEADRAEWARSKELWESEREKWSAERSSMIEAHEALVADVTRSNSSLEALTRSKNLAEKDRDFFRDQYTQASGFVSATRGENVELEQKAKIAEGQARDGVAMIKHMFEVILSSHVWLLS